MANIVFEFHGIEIEVFESELDGTLTVMIDTPEIGEDENGPKIRVYLNDEPVFDNPPYNEVKELKKLERSDA